MLAAAGASEIYLSGDNASRDVVRRIVQKVGQVELAILNAGAVQLAKFDARISRYPPITPQPSPTSSERE